MKVVVKATLVVAIVLLGFLCWRSIQAPIEFQKEVQNEKSRYPAVGRHPHGSSRLSRSAR